MPNFSLGAWLFLTLILLAILGLEGWMVSAGYISGDVLYATGSSIVTAIVGVVFHNAGATSALATPPTPTAATSEAKSV